MSQESNFLLNKFKFTVNLKDDSKSDEINQDNNNAFLKKLYSFIFTQPITESFNNSYLNYSMYKYTHEEDLSHNGKNGEVILTLNKYGNNILSIKITATYFYTFDFKGLANLTKLEHSLASNDKEKKVYKDYQKVFADDELLYQRQQVLYNCLQFLKKENLYSYTSIKSIGFSISFFLPFLYHQQRLIKFFKKKDNNFYNIFQINQRDTYTIKINHYCAEIHNTFLFLNHCRGYISAAQIVPTVPLIIPKIEIKIIDKDEKIEKKDITIPPSVMPKPPEITQEARKKMEELEQSFVAKNDLIHSTQIIESIKKPKLMKRVFDEQTKQYIYKEDTRNTANEVITDQLDIKGIIKPPLPVIKKNIPSELTPEEQKEIDKLKLKTKPISLEISSELTNRDTRINDLLKSKKNEELTENEIIEIIKEVIADDTIQIKKDSVDRYYLYSISDHAPINIGNTTLAFHPNIDDNSNYFKLYHEDMSAYEFNLQKNKKNPLSIFTKHKSTYEFEVNSWVTTSSNIVKKYASKKHQYKLSDDIEDISNNVINFTKQFSLIQVDDKELLSKVDDKNDSTIISRKKFENKIINNKNTIDYMKFTEDNLTKLLSSFIN